MRTIHHYGTQKPSGETLAPLKQQIVAQIGGLFQSPDLVQAGFLKRLAQEGLDIVQDQPGLEAVFSKLFYFQPIRYNQPAYNHRVRLFQKDVDVIRPDGRIDLDELALYAYRLDQAGNGDNQVDMKESQLGQYLSNRQYLTEAVSPFLPRQGQMQQWLKMLHHRRYSVSQQTLEACFDLAGHKIQDEFTWPKTAQICQRYDTLQSELVGIGQADQRVILGWVWQQFLKTRNFPEYQKKFPDKPIEDPQDLRFIQFMTTDVPVKKRVVERRVMKVPYHVVCSKGGLRFIPQKAEWHGPYWCKNNRHYRIKPKHFVNHVSPSVHRLKDALEHCAQKVLDVLFLPQHWNQLEQWCQQAGNLVSHQRQFTVMVRLLNQMVADALKLKPISVSVKNRILEHDNRSDEVPARFLMQKSKQMPTIEYSYSYFKRAYDKLYQDGVQRRQHKPALDAGRGWFAHLLFLVVEENMHALQAEFKQSHQHSIKRLFPKPRLKDYKQGFEVYVPPQALVGALTGDKHLYEDHPLEHDAKWVAGLVRLNWVGKVLGYSEQFCSKGDGASF